MIPAEAVEAAAKAARLAVDPTQAAIIGPYEASEIRARAALQAAAPHMLAEVATVDELDALPEGSMVRNDGGFYLKEALRMGISTWVTTNEQHYFKSEDISLPATVIYSPTP